MKHIVYKFDDGHYDERDFDARGSQILERGDIVTRRGMTWKIESVEQEPSVEKLMRIPTYWVHLSRVLVN
jgi:hypothetical protein